MDWAFAYAGKSISDPAYRFGRVSINTIDTSHWFRLDGDFRINPATSTTFDYQDGTTDTTGLNNYKGLLFRGPSGFTGPQLSGSVNSFTLAPTTLITDTTRLGAYVFAGKHPDFSELYQSAFISGDVDGAWGSAALPSMMKFWVTDNKTLVPYNIVTMRQSGRVQFELYDQFNDTIPTSLLGHRDGDKAVTKHNVEGEGGDGKLIEWRGTTTSGGFHWTDKDSVGVAGTELRDTVATDDSIQPLDFVYLSEADQKWRIASNHIDSTLAWAMVIDTISSDTAIIQSIGKVVVSHTYDIGYSYSLDSATVQRGDTIPITEIDQWVFNVVDGSTLDLKLSSLSQLPDTNTYVTYQELVDTSAAIRSDIPTLPTDNVTGTLTTNFIPVANGINTLGDSPLQVNSGNIGLGVSPSSYDLQILGVSGFGNIASFTAQNLNTTGTDILIMDNTFNTGIEFRFRRGNGFNYVDIGGKVQDGINYPLQIGGNGPFSDWYTISSGGSGYGGRMEWENLGSVGNFMIMHGNPFAAGMTNAFAAPSLLAYTNNTVVVGNANAGGFQIKNSADFEVRSSGTAKLLLSAYANLSPAYVSYATQTGINEKWSMGMMADSDTSFLLTRDADLGTTNPVWFVNGNSLNIGLKTTSPTAVLDVNGTLRVRSLPDSVAVNNVRSDASGNLYKTPIASAKMYVLSSDPDTISITAATPDSLSETTAGTLNLFTHSNGRLTLGGNITRNIRIIGSMSITTDEITGNTITVWIYKNGSVVSQTEQEVSVSGSADKENISIVDSLSMVPGDYLQVFYDLGTTADLIVHNINLVLSE